MLKMMLEFNMKWFPLYKVYARARAPMVIYEIKYIYS